MLLYKAVIGRTPVAIQDIDAIGSSADKNYGMTATQPHQIADPRILGHVAVIETAICNGIRRHSTVIVSLKYVPFREMGKTKT